jgi:hypothetical protein
VAGSRNTAPAKRRPKCVKMSETVNYQRDINHSIEQRFYTLEERMSRYESRINQILYIQVAIIILFMATSPQFAALLKLIGG